MRVAAGVAAFDTRKEGQKMTPVLGQTIDVDIEGEKFTGKVVVVSEFSDAFVVMDGAGRAEPCTRSQVIGAYTGQH